MTWQTRYEERKKTLLTDKAINPKNRKFWGEFFEKQEYKLKRNNGLRKLDESCYQTLYSYCTRFVTVNEWFGNKAWKDLTEADIQKAFDGIEDGKIKKPNGEPYGDAPTYYRKIWKGKPFKMLGKKELVEKVMEDYKPNGKAEVRFMEELIVWQLIDTAIRLEHKTLLALGWDVGENCGALLQLEARDCIRQVNDMGEGEYRVNLRKEILKRSRTARSEITNFRRTVEFLDLILKNKEPHEKLFDFGLRQAEKMFNRAVKIVGAKVLPNGDKPTLKDLRSSMACHLLKEGWSESEVNARLGHSVGSKELGRYVNYLALDRGKPKKKIYENQISKLTAKVEGFENAENLKDRRIEELQERLDKMEKQFSKIERLPSVK